MPKLELKAKAGRCGERRGLAFWWLGRTAARELGEEAACRTSGENRRREEGCRHRASDSAGPKLNVSADGGKGWREMAREPS